MALWITKQRATTGPVFGSTDNFEGLGIFFDTYKNNRPGAVFPYVSAMLGDGQTRYDSEHDNKETELAGCSARGIRNAPIPTKARLTYFQENYLQLELQYKEEGQWVQCFNVPNVTLPQVAYLGFSAHCGELTDNHDVIEVNAKNLYSTDYQQRPGVLKGKNAGKGSGKVTGYGKMEKEGGGWFWGLVRFLMFGMVAAGVYFAYTAYRVRTRGSRF